MTTRITILTCKTCGAQFAKSRRIRLPNGLIILTCETRAKYCSGACCAKAYRLSKAQNYASLTPRLASLTAS
jgi:hypothetical protein